MNESLTLAIVGHLVGDYLLQNDWMALNKKQRSFHCAIHCAIWMACVCLFAGWWSPLAAGLLFAAHFVQDRTQIIGWYMRSMGQVKFAGPPCAPWSIIVVDNVWHLVEIVAVWRWIA